MSVFARRLAPAVAVLTAAVLAGPVAGWSEPGTAGGTTLTAAIDAATGRFGVPAPVLTAVCYLEGRLGDHGGAPSVDGGYGCMHLVRKAHADTLDRAARLLGVPADRVRTEMASNMAGGAAVLADDAASLGLHPRAQADWYAPLALYSTARTRAVATGYADAVYRLPRTGFTGRAQTGEAVRVSPLAVSPDTAGAARLPAALAALPAGCTADTNVDYPAAVDCVVPASYAGLTFDTANRPSDLPVDFVTVHDIEGTAADAISIFWDSTSQVSVHYVVDTDGTVYQTLREKDVAYQAGNYWYNQRAVGIEHTGFDATGYQWYNATEYLASAQLAAYLLTKYGIPLDHDHVMSHGTTPAPTLGTSPNHVDPGPYWLWDYYLGLINQQGVPLPTGNGPAGVIALRPASDLQPLGSGGTETPANFNFFYLYTGPSTADPRIPRKGAASDITDETDNVEPALSYATQQHVTDPVGSGDELYQIWYGESTLSTGYSATGTLAWLAVPPGAAVAGQGTVVSLSPARARRSACTAARPRPGRTSSAAPRSAPSTSRRSPWWTPACSGTASTSTTARRGYRPARSARCRPADHLESQVEHDDNLTEPDM